MNDREVLNELIKALEREGGEATLDRLVYAYVRLKEAGRARILEAAKTFREITVREETLYKHRPEIHKYIVLSLANISKKLEEATSRVSNGIEYLSLSGNIEGIGGKDVEKEV